MIEVEERYLEMIKAILAKYPYTFYAFGSRVKNKSKKFSDLDLCVKEKIPDAILSHIEEDFETSDLPFRVEIILWGRCSPEFRQFIEKDLRIIKSGPCNQVAG